MRMDPEYEDEEMETNMESMFEHVNQMSNTDMPRDYLASMSRHFLRGDGEKFTMFQEKKTEACLLLEQRRPHWRKRKSKSSSQFLSMFYLLEKDVMESNDDVAKSLFVEAFNSREAFIEDLMLEFDETDRVERMMTTGNTVKVPGFVYDDDDDDDSEKAEEEEEGPKEFDLDNCVLEVAHIIEDLNPVDKTKYVKIFEKNGDATLGIHNTRIQALAKRKSATLSSFPQSVTMYPKDVKSGTKTFTKLTATSSVGASNTSAGHCMSINLAKLSLESRIRILDVLSRNDLLGEVTAMEEVSADDENLVQSQDFPNMYQSQTTETLLHCTLCEFMCRSKSDFENHLAIHPVCNICKTQVENNIRLDEHMKSNHQKETRACNKCGKEIELQEMAKHEKEHEMFESFKKSLEKNTKNKSSKSNPAAPKNKKTKTKVMNCYLVFVEEKRPTIKASNPSLTPVEITKKISEEWHKLTDDEKQYYKERAAQINKDRVTNDKEENDETRGVDCPKCEVRVVSQTELVSHILSVHVQPVASTSSSSDSTQGMHTLFQCDVCGKILFSKRNLDKHKEDDHAVASEATNNIESGDIIEVGDIEEEIVDDPAIEDDIENEANDTELVWVKLASIYWPAKLVRRIDGEISEIELFDDAGTKKTVEHIKIKPFEKLDKIPARRNKYWKEAYSLALEKLPK